MKLLQQKKTLITNLINHHQQKKQTLNVLREKHDIDLTFFDRTEQTHTESGGLNHHHTRNTNITKPTNKTNQKPKTNSKTKK